jgi:hypothetical protein
MEIAILASMADANTWPPAKWEECSRILGPLALEGTRRFIHRCRYICWQIIFVSVNMFIDIDEYNSNYICRCPKSMNIIYICRFGPGINDYMSRPI